MAHRKRKLQDPDYQDFAASLPKTLHLSDEEARVEKEERIRAVINKTFSAEMRFRTEHLRALQETLSQAQETLHELRRVAVLQTYSRAEVLLPQLLPAKQPRIHPAVKKLLCWNKKTPPPAPTSQAQSFVATPASLRSSAGCSKTTPVTGKDSPASASKTGVSSSSQEAAASGSARSCGEPNAGGARVRGEEALVEAEAGEAKLPRHLPPLQSSDRRKPCRQLRMVGRVLKQLVVGNTSRCLSEESRPGQASHKWMLYVRCRDNESAAHYVRQVVFTLHPSYAPNDVVKVSQAPFHLSRRGWGEFLARVQVHFRHAQDKPVDITHHLKLDHSGSGVERLGSETHVSVWLHGAQSQEKDMTSEEANALECDLDKTEDSHLQSNDGQMLTDPSPRDELIGINFDASEVQRNARQCKSHSHSEPSPGKERDSKIAANVELGADSGFLNTFVEVKQEETEPFDAVAWHLAEILPAVHDGRVLDSSIRVKLEPSEVPNAAMGLDIFYDDPASFSEEVVEEIEIKEEPMGEGLLEVERLGISPIKSEPDVEVDRFIGDEAPKNQVPNNIVPKSAVPSISVSNSLVPNSTLQSSCATNIAELNSTLPNSQFTNIPVKNSEELNIAERISQFTNIEVKSSEDLNIAVSNSLAGHSQVPNSALKSSQFTNIAVKNSKEPISQIPNSAVLNSSATTLLVPASGTFLLKVVKPGEKAVFLRMGRVGASTNLVRLPGHLGSNSGHVAMAKQCANPRMNAHAAKAVNGHIGPGPVAVPTARPRGPAPIAGETGPVAGESGPGESLLRSVLKPRAFREVCVKQEPPDEFHGQEITLFGPLMTFDPLALKQDPLEGSAVKLEGGRNDQRAPLSASQRAQLASVQAQTSVLPFREAIRRVAERCREQRCPSVERAMGQLAATLPLGDLRAVRPGFHIVHPYCAPSARAFLAWPIGKQRSMERQRAVTLRRLLMALDRPARDIWPTRHVEHWLRLHGFTPVQPSNDEASNEQLSKEQASKVQASNAQASNALASNALASNALASNALASNAQASNAQALNVRASKEQASNALASIALALNALASDFAPASSGEGRDFALARSSCSYPAQAQAWLATLPGPDTEEPDVDVLTVNNEPPVRKPTQPVEPDNSHMVPMMMSLELQRRCSHLADTTRDIGIALSPEVIADQTLYHAAERIILESVRLFSEELLRRSYCKAWTRNCGRPPNAILPEDIRTAVGQYFPLLSNHGLGSVWPAGDS